MRYVLCHFEQNGTTMSLLYIKKIPGRNHIFSPLRIETKLFENLLPLGIKDDELHFDKRPENA